MSLLGALPACVLLLAWLAAIGRGVGLRWALVWTAVVGAWVAIVGMELLSLFHGVHFGGVLSLWLVVGAIVVIRYSRYVREGLGTVQVRVRERWRELTRGERVLVLGMCLVGALALFVGWWAEPSNYDSQTYHLPRIRQWLQQGSLAHFASDDLRLLVLAPGAEILIAHTTVLSGSDRYAQLVQGLAWVVAVAGVSLVVKELGGRGRVQLWASCICLSAPAVLLQATSTQNDLLVGSWICVGAAATLSYARTGKSLNAVLASLALGLALATKGTALFWGAPVGVWLAGLVLWNLWNLWKRRASVGMAAAMALLLAAPNVGHTWRNMALFGGAFGPSDPFGLAVEHPSVQTFAANLIRNMAMHAQGTAGISAWLTAAVQQVLGWFGADANDPATTVSIPYEVFRFTTNEDYTNAPFVVGLLLGAAGLIVWRGRRLPRAYAGLGLALVAGLTLFCLLLKWQIWGIRLQVPFLVMGGAYAVAVVTQLGGTWGERIVQGCALVSVLIGLGMLVVQRQRPLLSVGEGQSIVVASQMQNRFRLKPECEADYRRLAEQLSAQFADHSPPPVIGVQLTEDSWEYPLWILLDEVLPQGYTLHHVGVRNDSRGATDVSRLDVEVEIDMHAGVYRLRPVSP
jgi:4-amino-4-deoxy-L-arabinose transferase-like glycosyltransferase